jgi:AcrR family transcriptional regulator
VNRRPEVLADRTEFWFVLVLMSQKTENAGTAERSQRRREQTARTLLDAARRVLAAKGYHGTKIVDIARAASVGVGTFYLYYPTKEALFLELVEDTVARLKTELDSVRSNYQRSDRAVARADADLLRFAQENRELFRIVFGHGASFPRRRAPVPGRVQSAISTRASPPGWRSARCARATR